MASIVLFIPELLDRILLFVHDEQFPQNIFHFCGVNRRFRAVGLQHDFWNSINYCAWTMKDVETPKNAFEMIRAMLSRLIQVSSVVIQKELLQTQEDWEFWASILRRCPRLDSLEICLGFTEPLRIQWNMRMLIETVIIDAEDFNIASCGIFRLLNSIACRTKVIHVPTCAGPEETIAFDCLFSGSQESLLLDGTASNSMTDLFMSIDHDSASRLAEPITGLHVAATVDDCWDDMPIFPNVRNVKIEMTQDHDSVERVCVMVAKCPNIKMLSVVVVKSGSGDSVDIIEEIFMDDVLNELQMSKPSLGIIYEKQNLSVY
ncbi:hypothetical protein NEOLI_003206 [Neolecta irregularis DAH-3]|uniref:F-box domain-containing protein n=1 Tax=Neolecta irregularis (strain DAH-3) TaxID=1198029 RepID=A0A1U7LPS8_NEOID|nr:hypothetical protein NEOLI_003206 [Neolecta irregularis DAH-3]|eukprot:OLL24665.1 hypothetical protein NEOLI_003206 [Neolecta irregularis DAH-3]